MPRRPFTWAGIGHQRSAFQRSDWAAGACAAQATSPRLDQYKSADIPDGGQCSHERRGDLSDR
jgi:hypothetical protein